MPVQGSGYYFKFQFPLIIPVNNYRLKVNNRNTRNTITRNIIKEAKLPRQAQI